MRGSFLWLLLTLSATFGRAQAHWPHPGASVNEFRKLIPGIIPEHFTDEVSEGGWHYAFKNDTLCSIYIDYGRTFYNSFFAQDFMTLRDIAVHYDSIYGKPVRSISRDTAYLDPGKRKRHTAYDTLKAFQWEARSMLITAGIYFTGSGPAPRHKPGNDTAKTVNYYELNIRCSPKPSGRIRLSLPEEKFFLGMHVRDFAKQEQKIFPEKVMLEYRHWNRDVNVYGTKGYQAWAFKKDTLDWSLVYTGSGKDSLDERIFKRFLSAGRQLIREITAELGPPGEFAETDTVFTKPPPNAFQHSTITRAKWELPGYSVTIDVYLGGGGKESFRYALTWEEERRKK